MQSLPLPTRLLSLLPAIALLMLMYSRGVVTAAEPSIPPQLPQEVDSLAQELRRLQASPDPATRQQLMERHWSMMQEHMRSVRMISDMSMHGCSDWMMMGPGMKSPGMMGPAGSGGCHWMEHGMMDQGGWGMPSSMSPERYGKLMQGTMQQMRQQMTGIAAEKNPTKRQQLVRGHYEFMYRSMQTMRGMGWMWAPNSTASLPEAVSAGATLVSKYCTQCHAAPSPTLHTSEEWSQVTSRMREHMQAQTGTAMPYLKTPDAAELDRITEYLGKHATAAR